MHTHTNFYLFSLALSDLVVLFLGLPMELYGVLDYAYPYEFHEWICKGRAYLIEFTSYASILVICSFTVERWLAICHHSISSRSPKISRAGWSLTIIFMWTVSAISALPMGFIVKINLLPLPDWGVNQPWTDTVSDDHNTVKDTQFCAMDVGQPEQQKRLIYFAFIAFFMAPAFLITLMYCQIGARIASTDSLLSAEKNPTRSKSTPTVIKMLSK
ncbi:7 transmembrane receptor [Cooperia oncophora]